MVKKSKNLREVFFGELGVTKKVLTMASNIINDLYDKFKDFNPISASNDEICFVYSENNCKQIQEYIDQKYTNMFRTEIFCLSCYQTKVGNIFIETFMNNTFKIKCCPKKYMPQIIKKYTSQEIESLDLMFIDDGLTAIFNETIFY